MYDLPSHHTACCGRFQSIWNVLYHLRLQILHVPKIHLKCCIISVKIQLDRQLWCVKKITNFR